MSPHYPVKSQKVIFNNKCLEHSQLQIDKFSEGQICFISFTDEKLFTGFPTNMQYDPVYT